jgi:O-antigen ligase
MKLLVNRLVKFSLITILFLIPFGVRKIIYQFISGFHEYETIFLYLSDVLLIIFVVLGFRHIKQLFEKKLLVFFVFLGIFGIFSFTSIFLAYSQGLAIYSFIRLGVLILFAVVLAGVISRRLVTARIIFKTLAFLAVLQSLIALGQFVLQKDLGLQFLGESILGQSIAGVAKVPMGGLHLIRGYGTFPHPNILSAFLLVGLFSLYYLWLRNAKCVPNLSKRQVEAGEYAEFWKYDPVKSVRENFRSYVKAGIFSRKIVIMTSIGLVMLGLLFTFSRTAWGIAVLLTILFLGWLLCRKDYRFPALRLGSIVIVIFIVIVSFFSWAIFPRANISLSEPAVTERISYNKIGTEIIQQRPLGVGIGNQVLYSVRNNVYKNAGLTQVWQWQPIHNLYLLMASEIGVIGLFTFLAFLVTLFLNPKYQLLNPKQNPNHNVQNSKQFQSLEFHISSPKDKQILNSNDRNLKYFKISDLKNWSLFGFCNLELGVCKAMLASLLLFGLMDHFLWTLEPGRLILWSVIGLVLGLSVPGRQSKTHQLINQ